MRRPLSLRLPRTPGIFSAAVESTSFSVAPCAGGLRTCACSVPGRAMSAAYCALPVTFSSASLRRGALPITVNAETGFTGTFFQMPLDPLTLNQLGVGDALAFVLCPCHHPLPAGLPSTVAGGSRPTSATRRNPAQRYEHRNRGGDLITCHLKPPLNKERPALT